MDLFKSFGRNKTKSKNVAKERLKLVLIRDRADISPRFVEMIKGDIVRVVNEYVEIDLDGLDIKLTRMKRDYDNTPVSALVASIPIIKVKDNYK